MQTCQFKVFAVGRISSASPPVAPQPVIAAAFVDGLAENTDVVATPVMVTVASVLRADPKQVLAAIAVVGKTTWTLAMPLPPPQPVQVPVTVKFPTVIGWRAVIEVGVNTNNRVPPEPIPPIEEVPVKSNVGIAPEGVSDPVSMNVRPIMVARSSSLPAVRP